MWTWLYSHPAHDANYYVKHVVKADPAWKNNCPLCDLSEGECKECLLLWDKGNGTLCEDKESPLNKWRTTHLGDPSYRTWYAGKIIGLASKVLKDAA